MIHARSAAYSAAFKPHMFERCFPDQMWGVKNHQHFFQGIEGLALATALDCSQLFSVDPVGSASPATIPDLGRNSMIASTIRPHVYGGV